MKYYRVDFKLKEEAKGTQNEEEFIPTMVCILHELYDMLDMQFSHYETCESDIINIRPATEEEVANLPHYYW